MRPSLLKFRAKTEAERANILMEIGQGPPACPGRRKAHPEHGSVEDQGESLGRDFRLKYLSGCLAWLQAVE